jgi:hypothetical protein
VGRRRLRRKAHYETAIGKIKTVDLIAKGAKKDLGSRADYFFGFGILAQGEKIGVKNEVSRCSRTRLRLFIGLGLLLQGKLQQPAERFSPRFNVLRSPRSPVSLGISGT